MIVNVNVDTNGQIDTKCACKSAWKTNSFAMRKPWVQIPSGTL